MNNELLSRKMRIIKVNSLWKILYTDLPKKKEKKISFVDFQMKSNVQTECKCNVDGFFSCELHDGSDPRKHKFFNLIKHYLARMELFNENIIIKYLNDINIVVFCLEQTREFFNRIERRKKELFEIELYECYLKKCTPRVVNMDDFDPKWDNIYLNLAAAKKQMIEIKVSLIKGGSRGLDGSLNYNHIPYIEKLHKLLENAYETMFLDFLLV